MKWLLCLSWIMCCFGQQKVLPLMNSKALDETAVQFPKPGSKKPLLVSVGFTQTSSTDSEKWNKQCASKYWADARVEYYELVDLQAAPSFVRGMILRSMRKSIKPAEAPHFVPFFAGDAEWKKVVGYSEADVVYYSLADAQGRVLWQERGPVSEAKCAAMETAIAKAQ